MFMISLLLGSLGGLLLFAFHHLILGVIIAVLGPLAVFLWLTWATPNPISRHTGRPLKRYCWTRDSNLWYETDGRWGWRIGGPIGEGSSALGLLCKDRKWDVDVITIYVCHDSKTYFETHRNYYDSMS